jgi:hypothetical protein
MIPHMVLRRIYIAPTKAATEFSHGLLEICSGVAAGTLSGVMQVWLDDRQIILDSRAPLNARSAILAARTGPHKAQYGKSREAFLSGQLFLCGSAGFGPNPDPAASRPCFR